MFFLQYYLFVISNFINEHFSSGMKFWVPILLSKNMFSKKGCFYTTPLLLPRIKKTIV